MKRIHAWILAASLALFALLSAHAQGAESIWLEAPASAYQAGDTLVVGFGLFGLLRLTRRGTP